MGQKGQYEWDDSKAALLFEKRGHQIIDIAEAVLESEVYPAFYRHPRYPYQLRAIGPYAGTLMTVVIEDRDDEFGEITHLSNFWKASKLEIEIYRRAHH